MKYNSRYEVENIGKIGTYTFPDFLGEKEIIVSRQLSSFWIASAEEDKGIAKHLKEDGFWEAWITLWVSRNVLPASKCINAGANYGYYTFMLAQHGCSVIAVEANTELVPYLQASVKYNGCSDRVIIIGAALADTADEYITLNVRKSTMNSSLKTLTHTTGYEEPYKSVQVKTISLDAIADQYGYHDVDFIIMDIEGSEPLAWKGMQQLLRDSPKCVTLMEFVPMIYEENGKPFYEEMKSVCDVSYVDYDGNEQQIEDFSFFEKDLNRMRMLVLRVKNQLN